MPQQIIYALQFSGQAIPQNDQGTVLKATTHAPSSSITSVVKQGVDAQIETVEGGVAQFSSTVEFLTDNTFTESGTITFGQGNSLRFGTVGEGAIGPSPEEGVSHGVVSWRLIKGTGVFENPRGFITSNFTVGAEGEVTDNQFGVIYLM
ncbi:MAG: hypothetical protein F6J90_10125 [Moorea sp. SIOASIH]|uniref:hypothetical protein n=1 Tax=Moorena sp. SIOASIH TaxID=2607817 RepID=UPI0013B69871|nr:hypothetical protein [Moorena sp. SIOASIH]NEO36659.1 hypothetical protein [Moorena sp. SIOASIH]